MKTALMLAAAALVVAGCATTPQTYNFDNSRSVDATFDRTWESVISYFAENNIPIATLEKDSGIIVAKNERYTPGAMKTFADCASAFMMTNDVGQIDVNVFVRPVDDNTTSVQVNTSYSMRQSGAYGSSAVETCNSNGTLEEALLDRIERDAV
ncbi:hypothetical protein ACFFUB_02385 [Algimonas porphyrae]|uniref:DUF4136 domain-containing protein n=1 Tax=Algimonas porphyrae TaxID=1128113 RepID=A0ABQ5V054_9PROT|nr:hypothetical protein [Algimonas porphyrae]GLQ20395.1 hypothetical protein GCM10007854_13500 [Algimonas porphyrae]